MLAWGRINYIPLSQLFPGGASSQVQKMVPYDLERESNLNFHRGTRGCPGNAQINMNLAVLLTASAQTMPHHPPICRATSFHGKKDLKLAQGPGSQG